MKKLYPICNGAVRPFRRIRSMENNRNGGKGTWLPLGWEWEPSLASSTSITRGLITVILKTSEITLSFGSCGWDAVEDCVRMQIGSKLAKLDWNCITQNWGRASHSFIRCINRSRVCHAAISGGQSGPYGHILIQTQIQHRVMVICFEFLLLQKYPVEILLNIHLTQSCNCFFSRKRHVNQYRRSYLLLMYFLFCSQNWISSSQTSHVTRI